MDEPYLSIPPSLLRLKVLLRAWLIDWVPPFCPEGEGGTLGVDGPMGTVNPPPPPPPSPPLTAAVVGLGHVEDPPPGLLGDSSSSLDEAEGDSDCVDDD